MRCFLDPRRVGAVVCCPRRATLCRMQLPEDCLGPSVRRDLGAARPTCLRGHGWGLGAEGLRTPNPASPRRRTRGEWVSGTGDPQQSSRAQGAGAVQPRFALWRGGAGAKKACVAFSIRGALGLWFAARGEFRLAEYRCQKQVLRRQCDGVSALSGRAGSGCMAGARAQKPSHAQSCFPTKENPWGLPFESLRSPAKQQGPGSQGQPRPALP